MTTQSDPHRRFAVTSGGESVELNPAAPDHEPDAECRRAAKDLAGGHFAPDVEDLFARAMSVGRSGGDVSAFLREQLRRARP